MANKKSHITYEERFLIEKMIKKGNSLVSIAEILDRGISTLSEEINKHGGRRAYSAKKAHERANMSQLKKKKSINKILSDRDLTRFVQKNLRQGLSPEAISKLLRKEKELSYASPKSIRKYMHIH